jgi:putative ABC transport system substrate-binding protein
LNLKMSVVEAKTPTDLEQSFARLAQEGAHGVAFGPDSMYFNERAIIGQLAAAHRLPVIALNEVMVRSGMLLYYGPHFGGFFRGAAGYVDRILKGAKPSDLPVQLPTKFELAINLKTARVLGVSIPSTIIARADEVIE